ncbi:MAG: urate hydroxylase PuuD [Polyangia bacterium]
MNGPVGEWLNLLLRWFHVFAGILWIGSTYYFTWLDGRMRDLAENKGQVWMVHSGGFYVVEKHKQLDDLSRKLHWFRWEALFTFLSGFLLLGVVYYMGGILVDTDIHQLTLGQASCVGLGTLVGGWVVYDLIWMSPIKKHERIGAVLCYVLLVGVIYALTHLLSGRAAYIHVGAMMGTIMTANVWMRILPGQRKLLAAMREGREPDQRLADRAKQRSKHNSFMIVPVVFTMISNHYPVATYASDHRWIVLSVIILVGWTVAKFIRE